MNSLIHSQNASQFGKSMIIQQAKQGYHYRNIADGIKKVVAQRQDCIKCKTIQKPNTGNATTQLKWTELWP